MKKRIFMFFMLVLSVFFLVSCGGTKEPTQGNQTNENVEDNNNTNNQNNNNNNQGNGEGQGENNQGNGEGQGENNQGNGEGQGENNQGNGEGQGENNQGNGEGQGENNQGNGEGQGENNQGGNEGNKTTATVDIYAFNDTHGNLKDTEGKGIGISKMTTLLNELTENKSFLFIHQGDMWQGSIESNSTYGLFGTEWLKNQGFACMTVGNHEFDWGPDKIIANREAFDLPILGINVVNKDTREKVDYLDSSIVVERDGLKIGIIGAIGNCLSSISASNVPGIDFATGMELTNLVKAESSRLRNEEDCDFIVYSLHGSPSQDADEAYDVSLSSDHYVDLVLEGHTHTAYAITDAAGVYHIQANANNESFYKIALTYNFETSTYTLDPVKYNTSYNSSYINYEKDSATEALFTKYESYYASAYEELGNNSSYKNANTLKSDVSKLYLQAGVEKWGSEYQIILGGGYTSCRGQGLDAGVVTYSKLAELFPFDNDIVLCSITGANLKRTSFYTLSNSNYYVTWSEYGNSVRNSIEDEEIYYLITDTYNSDFTANNLTIVATLSTEGKYARDLLAEYIKNGGYDESSNSTNGTKDNPKSVKEAIELAQNYSGNNANSAGAPYFYFTGKVSQVAQAQGSSGDLKQIYIEDLNNPGTTILIYWLSKNKDKNPNFTSTSDIALGDILVIYGAAFNYGGSTPEFSTGTYCYSINGVLTASN